ncbi:hypothetical protein NHQ30_011648 [Ciborinia camelliae]|nr:hypothetical protein NHQ30_011648 [Ciborinia camelliae]
MIYRSDRAGVPGYLSFLDRYVRTRLLRSRVDQSSETDEDDDCNDADEDDDEGLKHFGEVLFCEEILEEWGSRSNRSGGVAAAVVVDVLDGH